MNDSSGFSNPTRLTTDLAKITDRSQALSNEVYQLYSRYLTALAKALRHQSIQACYQICTNCYPTEFLQLDSSHQQRLQRSLRRAITNSIVDLLSQLQSIAQIQNPSQLSSWLQNTEESIGQTLPGLSKKMNYLLQQARVVPQQVPRQLIEAAVKADEINDNGGAKRPNILSVLVEKDSKESSEITVIVPVHVIFLRLPEIEFAEIELSKLRQQIHELRSKVIDLHRSYQHRQRQAQSLAAETAWHQSWFGAAETDLPATPLQ